MSIRPTLQPGQTIGVFAPSSYVEEPDIEASKTLLETRGYGVYIHPQTYARHPKPDGQMAGTDSEKLKAFNELWERDDVHAVWAAGGGNRALNLLDQLDYTRIKSAPKPLIGFSDTTTLLNAVYAHTKIITFHGPVFKALHSYAPEYINQCLEMLSSNAHEISLESAQIMQPGQATGALIGGCLSLFQYLVGTKDCPNLEGSILFLEDTGDHLSRIDRMFIHLKRMGVFNQIGGLILGEFNNLQEGSRPFGPSLKECILSHTEKTKIPILQSTCFGHGKNLKTFPIGQQAFLDANSKMLKFIP